MNIVNNDVSNSYPFVTVLLLTSSPLDIRKPDFLMSLASAEIFQFPISQDKEKTSGFLDFFLLFMKYLIFRRNVSSMIPSARSTASSHHHFKLIFFCFVRFWKLMDGMCENSDDCGLAQPSGSKFKLLPYCFVPLN